jgi:hypothetical protein
MRRTGQQAGKRRGAGASLVPDDPEPIPGWGRRGSENPAPPAIGKPAGFAAAGVIAGFGMGETLSAAERYVAAMRTAVLNGDLALAESLRHAAKADLRARKPGPPGRVSAIFQSVDRLMEFPEIGAFSGKPGLRPATLDRADLLALAQIVALVSYQSAFPGVAGGRP